jgi:hypothetical protein
MARPVGAAAVLRRLPEVSVIFRSSALAEDYLGDGFVEHYGTSRDVEWQHWLAIHAERVTAFGIRRSFDTLREPAPP